MAYLTRRRIVPEMMDDPAADRAQLTRSLAFVRFVNRRLGGAAAALHHLRRWTSHWPADRPIRIIDLGTGSADIPLAVARWALRAGLRTEITGIDLHETTLRIAREFIGDAPGIELLRGDARRLDEFAPGSFDFAHAGMFLHHLHDIEIVTVLRIMDRLATRGVIWNDLVRGPLPAAAVRLVTLLPGVPRMARHDAVVSVAKGFTRGEALDLARRAGIEHPRYRRHLVYRFTVVGETREA